MMNIVHEFKNMRVNSFKRMRELQTMNDAPVQKGQTEVLSQDVCCIAFKTLGKRLRPPDVTPLGSQLGGGAMSSLGYSYPGLMGTQRDAHGTEQGQFHNQPSGANGLSKALHSLAHPSPELPITLRAE